MDSKRKRTKTPTIHGLYRALAADRVDLRTREGKAWQRLTGALLERFPAPAPGLAQMVAQRCAFKLIRSATFEAYVLRGGQPAPSAEQDYLRLTGSIRADIQTLWTMAREGAPERCAPDLETYLAGLQKTGKLINVGEGT